MSLESWRAEFYSTEADDVLAEEALDHSIRKWGGLTAENLAKHGVRTRENGDYFREVVDGQSPEMMISINGDTCALCACFRSDEGDEGDDCNACPLAQARDGWACVTRAPGEAQSPYRHFIRTGDPEPMLTQLRRAKGAP